MKVKEIEEIIESVTEEFMDGIYSNTDDDGNVDFGNDVTYDSKEDLIEDFVLFLKEAFLK
jgi:hypothetical protein